MKPIDGGGLAAIFV